MNSDVFVLDGKTYKAKQSNMLIDHKQDGTLSLKCRECDCRAWDKCEKAPPCANSRRADKVEVIFKEIGQ